MAAKYKFHSLIPLQRFAEHLLDFLHEPFGVEHLELAAATEHMGAEVGSGTHPKFEVGIALAHSNLPLTMVDREVAHVELLVLVCPHHYALGPYIVVELYSKGVAEKFLGTEVGRQGKLLVRQPDILDTVEGVYPEVVAVGGISVELPEYIPPALEEFDTIGLEDYLLDLLLSVLLVVHGETCHTFHSLHNYAQTAVFGGYGLEQDTVLQGETFADIVAHGECGQDPILNRLVGEHLLVANVVTVGILAVTLYVDAEDVLDGILVAVEGGACQFHSLAHFCIEPLVLQLGKRYSACLADGVYQPDVFFELYRCLHKRKFYFPDKSTTLLGMDKGGGEKYPFSLPHSGYMPKRKGTY